MASSTKSDSDTKTTDAPAQRSAALPVWLLRPINQQDPPFFFAGVPSLFIVSAETAEQARNVAAAAAGAHDADAWRDEAASMCVPLAPTEPGIIARDFSPLPPAPAPAEPGPTAPPVNRDVPYVAGVGVVGETLSCTMGNWEGEPTGYAYAWTTDGVPNSATGAAYFVPPGDAGHSIACVVTATNAQGSTEAPASNAVAINAGAE
jgi:hypothetical protein